MRSTLLLFVVCTAMMVAISTTDFAQSTTEFRVRILDSKTHRPLKGRFVQISFSGMEGKHSNDPFQQVGRTQSNGVAIFRVKEPVPPFVDIVDLNGYTCSEGEVFPTRDVIQNGVVAPLWIPKGMKYPNLKKADQWCTPDPEAARPQTSAGEIVFLVHRLSLWWRLRRDWEE